MAFRLGYQISCNLPNNVLVRGASAASSRRFRSLSPSCIHGQLKDNVIPNASLAATFLHQRRHPRTSSEGFRVPVVYETVQDSYLRPRNFSQFLHEDDQEPIKIVNHRNSDAAKPYITIAKIRKGPVTHKLQPKNINPVATADINLNTFVALEEKTPDRAKFLTLKKLAQVQYAKALRNLSKKDEEVPHRYQLEAAIPKVHDENLFSVVDVRKKLQSAVSNVVPQLQPKNIKPFGNITNVQWRMPSVEKPKQAYSVLQNHSKESAAREDGPVRKGDSDRDINKGLSSFQHREYCTAEGTKNMSVEEVNPLHTKKESHPNLEYIDFKEEGDDLIRRNLERKRHNNKYMLYMSGGSVYSKRIPGGLTASNFKSVNETVIFQKPKVYAPPITVKIGPKWKLQSTGRPEAIGTLNPGANEKFVVPWPSYADRMKTSGKKLKVPQAPATQVDEALKNKYDAMLSKIQSDTSALLLKSQNILPDLGNTNRQSVNVLSREYSTGLRKSGIGKEQRGFFVAPKSVEHFEVLSKISAIQENHKGPKAPVKFKPQILTNVPISNPVTNLPIVHHVGKSVKVKLSRETLFKHIRNKLKHKGVENQFVLTKPKALNKTPAMMYSTLSSKQPIHQDISYPTSLCVQKMCCPSRVDESLRMFTSYLQPLNVPDHPQVCEGLLKSNLQNLNSRSLCNLGPSRVNIFVMMYAKIAEYFASLNSTRQTRPLQGGRFLTNNTLGTNSYIPSRTYSILAKYEARRKRKKEPCPCIKKKRGGISEPVLKRLPKHPLMERPPCKFEPPCPDPKTFRADFIAGVDEPKRKSLPKLEVDECPCPQRRRLDETQPALKRLPKIIFSDPVWKCETWKCEDDIDFRADKDLQEEKKTLPVLVPGTLPKLEKKALRKSFSTLKRLPKPPFEDRAEYKCQETTCDDLTVFRADATANLEVKPKSLPKLEINDCPCQKPTWKDVPQPTFKRLPKLPLDDRVWQCREVDECEEENMHRADRGVDLYKKKSLPVLVPGKCPPDEDIPICPPKKGKATSLISQNNSRKFSTIPNQFTTIFGHRFYSTNSDKGNEIRDCKKIAKPGKGGKEGCKQLTLLKCEPADSISCEKRMPRPTCKKTSSPYPAFSECKDEDDLPPLTECDTVQKHLQPKWPIISDFLSLQTPPPKQGKIDPNKEAQCVIKKLNLVRDGTKTCDNFYAPEKAFKAKEMLAKHKDDEEEDSEGDECEKTEESAVKAGNEVSTSVVGDAVLKATKSPDLDEVVTKPEGAKQLKAETATTPQDVCSPPKLETTMKSPKLIPVDISELTKKEASNKLKANKKKIPLKVTCPPKGFFQRILDFFLGKSKPALVEKSKKKLAPMSKLCLKGISPKTRPVFNSTKKTSASKRKVKAKNTCKTLKSESTVEVSPKMYGKTFESKIEHKAEEHKPPHKIEEVTKAALCPDEERETKKKSYPKTPKHEIAEVTKVALCPDERVGEVDGKKEKGNKGRKREKLSKSKAGESDGRKKNKARRGATSKVRSGKCMVPPHGNCPPKAREDCKSDFIYPPCKVKEAPYVSFSECYKNFPKLPVDECTEQEKRLVQQGIELDHAVKEHRKNNSREFSTFTQTSSTSEIYLNHDSESSRNEAKRTK